MSEDNENTHDVAAALEAGIAIAKIEDRTNFHDDTTGIPYVLVPKDMRIEVPKAAIELSDARAATPRARMGTAQHDELDSFIAHVNRFKDNASAIFADIQAVRLTAVLDYHPSGPSGARWGRHRPERGRRRVGRCRAARGARRDGPQPHRPDQGRVLAPGERDHRRGEPHLEARERVDLHEVPRAFVLGIPVFEGGTLYAIEARVRFAMREGKPSFSYSLYQHEKVLKDAFGEVRAKVAADTSLPVFAGSPES